ncbi:MauE/DoxX family redox-associated membrane protein [Steroidobacter sp.]|uniref:MauE/DoxX family redox-associated membrane protein n=1 Tax=Steroidobacter sp. TaxID=1978227 RepID=UPI001A53238F|nr:MauE/DoxX family redox-associated membrane protein [Steroidobacter sp.]MBL8266689.1 DoxX family protein [Steroidobacter sp.]
MLSVEPLIQSIVAVTLALLFASAAIHKLRDWSRFRDTLGRYELLPEALVPASAALLVSIEIAIVLGVLLPATRSVAAAGACILLLLYAAAMSFNLRRGRVLLDCGCGGFGERHPLEWWMVRRNVLLAAFSLGAVMPVMERALGWADLFVVSCATASLAGLYLAHATLAGNRDFVGR